jgi:hypothetical protein
MDNGAAQGLVYMKPSFEHNNPWLEYAVNNCISMGIVLSVRV